MSPNVSPPTLSEQERRGEFLFIKSCPLCHIHDREREITGAFVTDLKGLFTNPRRTEEVVRELILGGMPDFGMPGFRYTLNPEQLDDLIAFLKTR